ncbi:type VI secretion system tube protein TssD [Chitinophaga sp. 212800010-3]|uniref:type VI secretion system tube protein TssD n=1 Tax=unclassified Chitinophaga TaxID=2619133 RepID=UPI002DE5B20A|nr:hypothetical protein [Chitinophaga sp. 212800010-3]
MRTSNIYRLLLLTILCCVGAVRLMAQEPPLAKMKMIINDLTGKPPAEYELQTCSWSVTQRADFDGRDKGGTPQQGSITIILSFNKDKRILQWAADPAHSLSGKLISIDTTGKVQREIVFKGGKIRSMAANMSVLNDFGNNLELYMDLEQEMLVDGVPFKLKLTN